MRKIIKKFGNSVCIIFSRDEQKIYNIKKDKFFDVELNEIKETHGTTPRN